jgi:two-component system, LytTR family, response regulator
MTPPLRLAVADDEALARRMIARLLADVEDAEVAAECVSGDDLAATLAATRVDVLLLDVRMPGRDVFDVLEERARVAPAAMPAVIFTTAYERYAVRAFDLNAADYLVKPIAAPRFREALARARARLDDRAAAAGAIGTIGNVARDLGSRPTRLLVPERSRMVPIEVAAIDWIQAEGDYARVHAGGKSYLLARSLTDLESRLDPVGFIRIHRSAIVNADRIKEVRPEGSSRHTVLLADGTRLVLSRGRSGRLKRWRL